MLALDQISVILGQRTVVKSLSLTLHRGELLGLIGPNGAGKSSLIQAIAQLRPYQGQMRWHEQPLEQMPPLTRARAIAYLSQGDSIHWPLRVDDLVALGRHPYRGSGQLRPVDRQAIDVALQMTDTATLRQRRVTELSGGERARVRLARVLAVGAPLILADEPVAALDPYHQLNIMALLRTQTRNGISTIVVLHDLTLASRFCDRLLLLHQGQMVACGTAAEVLNAQNLQNVYGIQALIGEQDGQPYVVPWQCDASPPMA